MEQILEASLSGERSLESVVAQFLWQGPIPPPSEMMSYDDDSRNRIICVYEHESNARIAQKDYLIHSAVELEMRQSAREDLLVNADIKQIFRAQAMSAITNYLLIAAAIAFAVLGHESLAGLSIGALAVVNIATLFKKLHGDSEEDEEDDEGTEG